MIFNIIYDSIVFIDIYHLFIDLSNNTVYIINKEYI
jgi:hypothetical protein